MRSPARLGTPAADRAWRPRRRCRATCAFSPRLAVAGRIPQRVSPFVHTTRPGRAGWRSTSSARPGTARAGAASGAPPSARVSGVAAAANSTRALPRMDCASRRGTHRRPGPAGWVVALDGVADAHDVAGRASVPAPAARSRCRWPCVLGCRFASCQGDRRGIELALPRMPRRTSTRCRVSRCGPARTRSGFGRLGDQRLVHRLVGLVERNTARTAPRRSTCESISQLRQRAPCAPGPRRPRRQRGCGPPPGRRRSDRKRYSPRSVDFSVVSAMAAEARKCPPAAAAAIRRRQCAGGLSAVVVPSGRLPRKNAIPGAAIVPASRDAAGGRPAINEDAPRRKGAAGQSRGRIAVEEVVAAAGNGGGPSTSSRKKSAPAGQGGAVDILDAPAPHGRHTAVARSWIGCGLASAPTAAPGSRAGLAVDRGLIQRCV